MVEILRHLHDVDGELDIHVALDLAPPGRVRVLLGRLCHHRVAVVVEPVDEGPDRRVFLVTEQGGVIKRPDQAALGAKEIKQTLVIDVETKGTRCGI